MLDFIKHCDSRLIFFEKILLKTTLLILICLSFGQVIMRNFSQGGYVWIDIVLRQGVLWLGFLGACLAVSKNQHLKVDIFTSAVPKSAHKFFAFSTNLITAIVCLLLTKAAWVFLLLEKEAGSKLIFDIPIWVFITILPYSFFVIGVRFILKAHTALTERSQNPS